MLNQSEIQGKSWLKKTETLWWCVNLYIICISVSPASIVGTILIPHHPIGQLNQSIILPTPILDEECHGHVALYDI